MKPSTLKITIAILVAVLLIMNALRIRQNMLAASDGLIPMTGLNLTVFGTAALWWGLCVYMLYFFFKNDKSAK